MIIYASRLRYCTNYQSARKRRLSGEKSSPCGLSSLEFASRLRRRFSVPKIKADDFDSFEDPLEVQDIDREYCNDFVCTSSPLVEETVKAFAVDLQRPGKWTLSRFPDDVTYKDPLRSFRGKEKYQRLQWIAESVTRPRVKVNQLKMIEKDVAEVQWRLTGKVAAQPIDITIVSTIKLNPLSGRIMEHRDEWDLTQCPPPAAIAFTLSRTLWSLDQWRKDARDGLQDLEKKAGLSIDEDESPYLMDPRDPYTFYEKSNDNFKRDALSFLTFVALIYLVYRAYLFLFQL